MSPSIQFHASAAAGDVSVEPNGQLLRVRRLVNELCDCRLEWPPARWLENDVFQSRASAWAKRAPQSPDVWQHPAADSCQCAAMRNVSDACCDVFDFADAADCQLLPAASEILKAVGDFRW